MRFRSTRTCSRRAGTTTRPYRLLTTDGVRTVEAAGRRFLEVDPAALTLLTAEAMRDIAHLLRPGHLAQLRAILDDPEASHNDRFVALELLKNACIAAGGVLPSCQDTGTAIVMGKKGELVLTGGDDEAAIARGVFDTYQTSNLRYSQMAPLDMYREEHRQQPAGADRDLRDSRRRVQLPVHGQGRRLGEQELPLPRDEGPAQPRQPHAVPRREAAHARHRGVPAVPPRDRDRRHVGGVRAQGREATRRRGTSTRSRPRATRSAAASATSRLEQKVLELTQQFGIGAQFGGKYFCHDVRVIRLPRHGASCPVAHRRLVLGRSSGARQDHAPRASSSKSSSAIPREFLPEVDRGRSRER